MLPIIKHWITKRCQGTHHSFLKIKQAYSTSLCLSLSLFLFLSASLSLNFSLSLSLPPLSLCTRKQKARACSKHSSFSQSVSMRDYIINLIYKALYIYIYIYLFPIEIQTVGLILVKYILMAERFLARFQPCTPTPGVRGP
jgi:hypothetical protein